MKRSKNGLKMRRMLCLVLTVLLCFVCLSACAAEKEPAANAQTDAATEAPTEAVTEATTEATTAPTTEPVTEPVAEEVTHTTEPAVEKQVYKSCYEHMPPERTMKSLLRSSNCVLYGKILSAEVTKQLTWMPDESAGYTQEEREAMACYDANTTYEVEILDMYRGERLEGKTMIQLHQNGGETEDAIYTYTDRAEIEVGKTYVIFCSTGIDTMDYYVMFKEYVYPVYDGIIANQGAETITFDALEAIREDTILKKHPDDFAVEFKFWSYRKDDENSAYGDNLDRHGAISTFGEGFLRTYLYTYSPDEPVCFKIPIEPSDLMLDKIYTRLVNADMASIDHYVADGETGKREAGVQYYSVRFRANGQEYLVKGNYVPGPEKTENTEAKVCYDFMYELYSDFVRSNRVMGKLNDREYGAEVAEDAIVTKAYYS